MGGSNEYPQSMFWSKNKKNNVYTCKPHFYYIKWGLSGSKLYRYVFVMFSSMSIKKKIAGYSFYLETWLLKVGASER